MTDYEKFKKLYDEIDVLLEKKVHSTVPDFLTWKTKVERFLISKYGKNSYEYKQYNKYHFGSYLYDTPLNEEIEICCSSLVEVKAIFTSYLEDLKEEQESITKSVDIKDVEQSPDMSKVFIVHGHDEVLKQTIARIIEKQGINAIILHEQANQGATIIEKFEKNSNVGAAICLFTPDDIGKAKSDGMDNYRARQNVVFEAGYFMGKLGRDRVIFIADPSVEMLSDLQGVVYTDSKNWEIDLVRELKAMGFNIDLNKLYE